MQDQEYYEWGKPISDDELQIREAQLLAEAVAGFPFATLVGLRRKDGKEGVGIEFAVQLPQSPPVPILPRERLVVVYDPDEDNPPEVHLLRKSFPSTIHQNLAPLGEPKQMCLFEEEYREVRPFLTPQRFLQRIGDWLRRAAVEKLHSSDQPLEPFVARAGRIVFDRSVFETEEDSEPAVIVVPLSDDLSLLRALEAPDDLDAERFPPEKRYLLLPIEAPPWHARLLHHCPRHLGELRDLLGKLPLDIEDEMRQFIRHLRQSHKYNLFGDYRLIIVLLLPKTRTPGGAVEDTEWVAFLVDASVRELAVTLGLLAMAPGGLGAGQPLWASQSQGLETVGLLPFQPVPSLDKAYARRLSGLSVDTDPTVVAIGAGALGSQVILNLARQGFGDWTIVDHDRLLPHNLVRHSLSGLDVGQNKAKAVAAQVNFLFPEEGVAHPLPCDVLSPGSDEHELTAALEASDLVLDFSTSHAVSRMLAMNSYAAGCMTAFLAPSGRYLVILSEGQERLLRLDDLEMQLAVAVLEKEELQDLYEDGSGEVSYAGSCRDATVQLAQDWVGIHAGVASKFIKTNALSPDPAIAVWEWSETGLQSTCYRVPVHSVDVRVENNWTVRLSSQARDLMRHYRERRLPKETGGVVLGQFDMTQQTIYVATVLPSPPDSIEWPASYIRGVKGLAARVEEVRKLTADTLSFVGEWHSHPPGVSSQPSVDDRTALASLTKEMGIGGLAGLIIIQGEERDPALLVG